jgi:DNA-binding response OmpR family regulator
MAGMDGTVRDVVARRVLVVEDDMDAAEVLSIVIENLGHTCAVAHGGRDAIRLAATFDPEVVLLDIGLPDLDGLSLARALRVGVSRGAYLVGLSGYGDPADHARASAAGLDRYLVKPLHIATIAAAIASATPRRADDDRAVPRRARSITAPAGL